MDEQKVIQRNELEVIFGKNKGKIIKLEKDVFYIGKDSSCDLVLDIPTMKDREVSIENKKGNFLLKTLENKEISISGEKVTEKILENDDIITIGNLELKFRKIVEEETADRKEQIKQKLFSRIIDLSIFVLLAVIVLLLVSSSLFFYLERKVIESKAEKFETIKTDEVTTAHLVPSEYDIIDLLADAHRRMHIGDAFYKNYKLDESYLYRSIIEWQVIIDSLEHVNPKPRIYVQAKKKQEKAQKELDQKMKYLKDNAYAAYVLKANDQLKAILEHMMRIKPVAMDKDYLWTKKKYLQLIMGTQEKDKGGV